MGTVALPFRFGGFGSIVIDPPWDFDDQANRMKLPYESMTDSEILALPIDTLAADRGHLYCWTTDAHLELALQCVRRWGFVFKRTIPWVKTLDAPAKLREMIQLASLGNQAKRLRKLIERIGRVRIGGGHYVRSAHELCLFATRSLTALVRDVPSVIFAPRRDHSEKPEELQDIAERISPGPRIEIFARRQRSGWLCWGDQCPVQEVA